MKRDKHRYILVESTTELEPASQREFELELTKEILRNIGEINYYKANPRVMKYVGKNSFILKCGLAQYKETILALTFIKRIGAKEIGFYTLNSSGTILALTKPKDKSAKT